MSDRLVAGATGLGAGATGLGGLEKYEIQKEIGRGGMGVVYKVRHTLFDRLEAVKVVRTELSADAAFLDRFRREAKVLAAEASTAAIDAAAATFQKRIEEARTQLQAEWKGRGEDRERKVAEGRATPIELALWVLLGGLGAGGTKTVLERILIGKRAGSSNVHGG